MKLIQLFMVQILVNYSFRDTWPDLLIPFKGYVPLIHISVDVLNLIKPYLSVGYAWQNLAIYSTCFLLLWMISVKHTVLKQPNRRE